MTSTQLKGKERLLEFGIKPSLHRIAVIEYLMENPIHPTADKIFNELYPSIPTLSKTTVYNVLKLLDDQGAIRSILIDEKSIRYDADISVHAHFKCTKCGNIHDVFLTEEDKVQIKGVDQFVVSSCQIYFKGYCEQCKQEIN